MKKTQHNYIALHCRMLISNVCTIKISTQKPPVSIKNVENDKCKKIQKTQDKKGCRMIQEYLR